MSTMQDPNQATGNIYINNMTMMSQPQVTHTLQPENIPQAYPAYDPNVQIPIALSDPFEQMRIANRNYQTAKQSQKLWIEIQEQQNLHADYQAMCLDPPLPIQNVIVDEIDNMINLHNSSLWNVAQWSIASTGLTILQALCCIITCICAATWGRIRILCNMANDWSEPLNIWTIFFAKSGQGKSTLFGRLLAPFNEYQAQWNRNLTSTLSDEMQEIVRQAVKDEKKRIRKDLDLYDPKALKKLKSNLDTLQSTESYKLVSQNNHPATLITSRSTESGLRKTLEGNGNAGFLAAPEPEGLISILKNNGVELLKKSYYQETDNYISGNGENLLNFPSVSLLFGCQTDSYLDLTHSKSYKRQHASGFYARLLPVLSNKKGVNTSELMPPYISHAYKNSYELRIKELITYFYTQNKHAEKYDLVCNSKAIKFLEDIRQQYAQYQVTDPAFETWRAKFAGKVARIAGALHLWKYGLEALKLHVEVDSFNMAYELMNAIQSHAWYLYSDCGLAAETNALKIQNSLVGMYDSFQYQRIMAEGISTTQIAQRLRLGRQQINTALRLLQANKWCVILDRGHGNLLAHFRPEFFVVS